MDEDKQEAVRKRAYSIWEEQGKPDGRHDTHWDQAVKELDGTDPATPAVLPTDKPVKKRTRTASK